MVVVEIHGWLVFGLSNKKKYKHTKTQIHKLARQILPDTEAELLRRTLPTSPGFGFVDRPRGCKTFFHFPRYDDDHDNDHDNNNNNHHDYNNNEDDDDNNERPRGCNKFFTFLACLSSLLLLNKKNENAKIANTPRAFKPTFANIYIM